MSGNEEFTERELKSQFYIKSYAWFCLTIFLLFLLGFFKNLNLREEAVYLLFFLVLSFNLWWLPYDTKASYPELSTKEAIMVNLKNPAVISILLAMIVFIPPALYSLMFSS